MSLNMYIGIKYSLVVNINRNSSSISPRHVFFIADHELGSKTLISADVTVIKSIVWDEEEMVEREAVTQH